MMDKIIDLGTKVSFLLGVFTVLCFIPAYFIADGKYALYGYDLIIGIVSALFVFPLTVCILLNIPKLLFISVNLILKEFKNG